MTTQPIFNKQAISNRLQTLGWAVNSAVPGYALTDTLRRFQRAHFTPAGLPLEVDGDYGPETEAALFTTYIPKRVTFIQVFLAVAASQLGVSEAPKASNSGPQVSLYLASLGLGPGNSWCMAYVYWCVEQTCLIMGISKNPLPKTGHCMTMWAQAAKAPGVKRIMAYEAKENPSLVLPGMIPIWLIAPLTQAGHTGIIDARVKLALNTYEGNSNENGSRDGELVAHQHKRTITDSILMGLIAIQEQ